VVEVKIEDGKNLGFGDGQFQVIAGPCSVESYEQVLGIAKVVKNAGATFLRGGAFKPRTSPRSFQGLGEEGLKILSEVKREVGIPVVSELMAIEDLELFNDIDIIQVGARNMQNFRLLKELGTNTDKPIILKRGLSATIKELILAAEYIIDAGNENVILCERGIRTFETEMRNTLDLGIVPVLHRLSALPIIVDPSHSTGKAWMVEAAAVSATAIGADGLIIEVHNDPKNARCDGDQSQTPEMFETTMKKVIEARELATKWWRTK
jgi:3-deoxy-7-phosphoheptulonate synthase